MAFISSAKAQAREKTPAAFAKLYRKRCGALLGHDTTIPISVNGELRFICDKNKQFEISTPQGEILNSIAHSEPAMSGFMHSPTTSTAYWISHSDIKGMDALHLTSWNYQINTLKESPISFNSLFRKGFFSGTFEPIKTEAF